MCPRSRESKSKSKTTPKPKSTAKAAEQKQRRSADATKTRVAIFGVAWKAAYDGEPNWGQLAKALPPLLREHDAADVLRHWRYYLEQTPGRFASANRFANTYGAWDPSKPDPDAWKHNPLQQRPGESIDAMIERLARAGY